jgi:RNA polymerase sigma-70 factor (family 1)
MNSETLLLAEVRTGSKKAFEQLYRNYKFRVYRTIHKQISDDAIAEELMQDVFIKIWEKRSDLDLEKSFVAYLFSIAGSRVVDYCRKAKRDQAIKANLQLIASEISEEPLESTFSREEDDLLARAIEQLPPQRKKIFLLCKLEGKSYEEVSRLYGVSTSTISDHIVKATKFLRKCLVNTPAANCILFVPFLFVSVKSILEKII